MSKLGLSRLRSRAVPVLGGALATLLAASTASALTIVPTNDPQALLASLGSQGVQILSVEISPGQDFSDGPPTGSYTQGPLGMPPGILVTSGTAAGAAPPNDSTNTGSSYAGGGLTDPLCAGLANTTIHDAVRMTIQFTLGPGADGIAFDWFFGSEEYPEYVGSYNDSAGVFLRSDSGPGFGPYENILLDLGGNPITLNGPFFSGQTVIVPTAQNPITEYDGTTPHITTSHPLQGGPGVLHEMVIVVCDALDSAYDSGLFIGGLRSCSGVCESIGYCGDNAVTGNEDCDDGNNINTDGCSNTCQGPDTDGDGVSDVKELYLGGDPIDNDGDGLLDALESNVIDADGDGVPAHLDPTEGDVCSPSPSALACDQDGDGLTNAEEIAAGTDPMNVDTDGDLLPDGVEVEDPGSPADADGDGLIDALESNVADADGDGVPDQGDPSSADPCAPEPGSPPCDQDGDGLTNAQEIALGTDPMDADSDDDGVPDGAEPAAASDTDGDGLINALDPDSDNDFLFDGTELGLGCGGPGTDLGAGNCIPDADMGATITDPLDPDTDDGGLLDGIEDANHDGVVGPNETDPSSQGGDDGLAPDADGDGLPDSFELAFGSDPNDADSDDDGAPDGIEIDPLADVDGDGLPNFLDPDSDNDGLFDGTEMGYGCASAGTDTGAGHCLPDGDGGATTTSPVAADTDGGGANDGAEDYDHDGVVDPGEPDPTFGHGADDGLVADSDGDGLSDGEETIFGSDPNDGDSDDDGVLDGDEPNPTADSDGDGLINALDPDSDDDGIPDATELGYDCPPGAGNCVPDADGGATTTDALSPDSDSGGVLDGVEDKNGNGVVDPGETDPSDPFDDVCLQNTDCVGGADGTFVCDPSTSTCVEAKCDASLDCPPPDACHLAGACDPAAGTCAYADAPDGLPCDDANECTVDACQKGACAGTSQLDGTPCDGGVCYGGFCVKDSITEGTGGAGGEGGSGNGGGEGGSSGGGGGPGGSGAGSGEAGGAGGDAGGASANENNGYSLLGGGCSTPAGGAPLGGSMIVLGLAALALGRRRRG